MSEYLALGIDLGGTNLRTGIVDRTGRVSEFLSRPINPELSGEKIVREIAEMALSLNEIEKIKGAGVGLAANILKGGILKTGLTTLPGLGEYPFIEELSRAFSKPCLMDNDANLTLLGEAHFGAARGVDNVLLITLGTGIGGGLILDGHLRTGAHSSGSEIGLTIIFDPDKGSYLPVESLASPGALAQRLNDPGGKVFELARLGDENAKCLIKEMYDYLGILITNAHLLLDLDLVLLGGGIAAVGEVLLEGIQEAFTRICPPDFQFDLHIELGALPPDRAGVIGAACLFFESEGWLPKMYKY